MPITHMNGSHDIVATTLLLLCRDLESLISDIKIGLHLSESLFGNLVDTQRLLGLSQPQPKLSPGPGPRASREEIQHLLGRISGAQRRAVNIEIGHLIYCFIGCLVPVVLVKKKKKSDFGTDRRSHEFLIEV